MPWCGPPPEQTSFFSVVRVGDVRVVGRLRGHGAARFDCSDSKALSAVCRCFQACYAERGADITLCGCPSPPLCAQLLALLPLFSVPVNWVQSSRQRQTGSVDDCFHGCRVFSSRCWACYPLRRCGVSLLLLLLLLFSSAELSWHLLPARMLQTSAAFVYCTLA